jgi:hypothetical protein
MFSSNHRRKGESIDVFEEARSAFHFPDIAARNENAAGHAMHGITDSGGQARASA